MTRPTELRLYEQIEWLMPRVHGNARRALVRALRAARADEWGEIYVNVVEAFLEYMNATLPNKRPKLLLSVLATARAKAEFLLGPR